MDHTRMRTFLCSILMGMLTLLASPAQGFEAKDNDQFFISYGSSNIEVKGGSDLISGSNFHGGVRVGIFWTFFFELGYGAIEFRDSYKDPGTGAMKDLYFRTTGGNYGFGTLIPIRNLRLGMVASRHAGHRWAQIVTDQTTGAQDSRVAGRIDFNSVRTFVRFGQLGSYEVGVRREIIRKTDSVVSNSFGPYLGWNINL